MKSIIGWFEIPVADFSRARKFYEQLLDFEMHVVIDEEKFKMGLLSSEAGTVGGAIVWHPEFYKPSAQDGPLLYLNANPDLTTVLNKVVKAGGNIIIPKRQVSPQFGFMAVFTDSEGNRLALHAPS